MRGHILFIAPSAYILSGLASWLDYLEPGLHDKGWKVTIGLVEGSGFHNPETYLLVHPHIKWIVISCLTGTPEGRIKAIQQTVMELKPDLVASVNIPDAYPAVNRLRGSRKYAPKIVMAVHGIEAYLYDDIKLFGSILDGVVCTNRLACKLSEIIGNFPENRIHYGPCGAKTVDASFPDDHINTLTIAYSGRLEQWQKRVHDLPEIIKELEKMGVPFELLIAGNGPEDQALRKSLGPWVNKKTVTFLGRLSSECMHEKLHLRAHTLLMPSFWETGPIVNWEAMAAGVVVVSSRFVGSGLEGALKHGENALLFPVGDHKEAAIQLSRLVREPGLATRLAKNGYQIIKERYDIHVSINAWDTAFKEILDLPDRTHRAFLPEIKARGRLDNLLGIKIAEIIRGKIGKKVVANDAGGEWPHSYSGTECQDDSFWGIAKTADSP
mgnify:FL=1